VNCWQPVDDLSGLDAYDRNLASDMDDNRPIYPKPRCSCCERRQGGGIDPCSCSDGYCLSCLLCDLHCNCPDEPVVVRPVA
jgi:hypothetical protein